MASERLASAHRTEGVRSAVLLAHVLIGEPEPTSPEHALATASSRPAV